MSKVQTNKTIRMAILAIFETIVVKIVFRRKFSRVNLAFEPVSVQSRLNDNDIFDK